MDIDTNLLATAERLFDQDGFHATGMGRLVEESGLSSRTVYKHVGSKNALMARVLAARGDRFFAHADFTSTRALFDSVALWARREGARGCLFFRLRAETGGAVPEIEAAVAAYHAQLHARLAALVRQETGAADPTLTDQLLALFEGATTAATYRGPAVIEAAGACAVHLIERGRSS
ncbi:TetR/AcrR family transcriptional regulator [Salinisphaera sp. Q1T1-3]|uniref:TetR/AcrR family transcriptional regulator n=1 Tax=Salinisphaera sp. Q1T1-3 TaxID=2321229 RepID=UPI000E7593E7|nr:TetR/AcrR family transcriptional regulator [Salinisphaera sp. Q1T1-3]RJS93013.1 TetR/AcrR family transcriptional regulator [Salinisphaera sp. Q1T1-3]